MAKKPVYRGKGRGKQREEKASPTRKGNKAKAASVPAVDRPWIRPSKYSETRTAVAAARLSVHNEGVEQSRERAESGFVPVVVTGDGARSQFSILRQKLWDLDDAAWHLWVFTKQREIDTHLAESHDLDSAIYCLACCLVRPLRDWPKEWHHEIQRSALEQRLVTLQLLERSLRKTRRITYAAWQKWIGETIDTLRLAPLSMEICPPWTRELVRGLHRDESVKPPRREPEPTTGTGALGREYEWFLAVTRGLLDGGWKVASHRWTQPEWERLLFHRWDAPESQEEWVEYARERMEQARSEDRDTLDQLVGLGWEVERWRRVNRRVRQALDPADKEIDGDRPGRDRLVPVLRKRLWAMDHLVTTGYPKQLHLGRDKLIVMYKRARRDMRQVQALAMSARHVEVQHFKGDEKVSIAPSLKRRLDRLKPIDRRVLLALRALDGEEPRAFWTKEEIGKRDQDTRRARAPVKPESIKNSLRKLTYNEWLESEGSGRGHGQRLNQAGIDAAMLLPARP